MLSKSYGLLSYLNRAHSPLSRGVLGAGAWVGTMAVTGRPSLAALVRSEFADDEFKQAFRTVGWLVRRGWPGRETVIDDFFDFTVGASRGQLFELAGFLEGRRGRQPDRLVLGDLLFVQAALIHDSLDHDRPVEAEVARFRSVADDLLADVSGPPMTPSRRVAGGGGGADRDGDFSLADATVALRALATTLPLNRWRWYVISGTFLGLVREGGFLGHDYDIDVGMDADGLDESALLDALDRSDDFVVKKVDRAVEVRRVDGRLRVERPLGLVKLVHASGINVDIFIHHRDGDVVWHGSQVHRWDNSPFELTDYELAGVPVLGPVDHDRYLTENYGTWRVPVTDFNCTTDTPNLVVARSFTSVALFLKKLAVSFDRDPAGFAQLVDTLIHWGLVQGDRDSRLRLREDVLPE